MNIGKIGPMQTPADRPWDAYLTTTDVSQLADFEEARVGPGESIGLLLIDLHQSAFLRDRCEGATESGKEVTNVLAVSGSRCLEKIKRLLTGARRTGMPIVHVSKDPDSEIGDWYGALHGAKRYKEREGKRGKNHYDIHRDLAPIPGEYAMSKAVPSAFLGTPLLGLLNGLGVDTLIVAGQSTSGCVRASVVDGASYRYRMLVVEDCVFDRFESSHAMALFDMHDRYADVIGIRSALSLLQE